jgi:hypothetical protein
MPTLRNTGATVNRRLAVAVAVVALGAAAVSAAAHVPSAEADSRALVRIYAPRGGAATDCARVYPLARSVERPAVLTGAMRALVAGPTAAERRRGYGGWFSRSTAATLKSVHIVRGTAYVDFRNFSRVVPNASSSCGSALLLAQLDRTALQFQTVRRAVYSFDGSRRAFYEWLQRDVPPLG